MEQGSAGKDSIIAFLKVQLIKFHCINGHSGCFISCLSQDGTAVQSFHGESRLFKSQGIASGAAAKIQYPGICRQRGSEYIPDSRHIGVQSAVNKDSGMFIVIIYSLIHRLVLFLQYKQNQNFT